MSRPTSTLPLTDRRRREIATLARRKGRDELGQFLVEGKRSIRAALDAGAPLVEVVVAESVADDPDTAALADRLEVPVLRAPDRVVDRLSDVKTSQGLLAVASIRRSSMEALKTADRILLLDGVQDPGNVGTILRTAAWFGVGFVVAGPGTADFFGPKVVRASMGAIWDVQLAETDDMAELVRRLRYDGHGVFAADMDGVEVAGWKPPLRSALVLGSEAHGPSAGVVEACAGAVTIPPAGAVRGTESLNVAAAAAILIARWSAGPD